MDDSKLCTRCFEPVQDAHACEACEWHRAPARELDGELEPGSLLRERYHVGQVLGRGGFGITYLGWDARLRRKRAIKEYFPRGVATRAKNASRISVVSGQTELLSDGIQKFLNEAQLLARFENHPCIVSPRDFFEENGTAYLVMECLVGETLAHYVQRAGGRIAYAHALQFLEPVIRALSTLHAQGILHRDVSPENIFLTVEQQPKLLDFGAARQRSADQVGELTVILRENYAPPEQYTKAGKQGPWTDVYALGATLYRSITGQNAPRSVDRLIADAIEPPSQLGVAIPARCERALMAAMALRPEDRPDIDTLLTGLRSELEREERRSPAGSREPGALRRALARARGVPLRPHVRSIALAGAIAAGVLALVVLWPRVSEMISASVSGSAALAARTLEELESHAAQPRPEQPAEPQPGASPPAADAPGASDVALVDLPRAGDALDAPESVSTRVAKDAPGPRLVLNPPAQALARAPLAQPTATPGPVSAHEPIAPPALAQPGAADGASARLIVRTNVGDDIVEIDGSDRGPSGPSGFAIAQGHHRIRVRKAGHRTFEAEIDVTAGERRTLQARLEGDEAYARELSRDGVRLLSGAAGDWPEGLRKLQSAAELGDGEALGALGELYAYGGLSSSAGTVIPADDVRALVYHRRAAEQGERMAQNRLARRLEDGRWPPRSESATPQVGAQPTSLFGFLTGRRRPFRDGLRENKRDGLSADFAEAFRWHKAAAMRGNAGSQKRLGFMYAAGRGVQRNEFTALYWFLEAARQGDAEAQYVAGMCYSVGEGYSKNDEAARCWLRRAAGQGYEPARVELQNMGFDPEANGGWGNAPKVCNFRGP